MSEHFLNIPAVYRLGTRWAGYIPAPLAYAFSQGIADLSFMMYKSAANTVKGNLRSALPSLTERDISLLTRNLFRNYGRYLVDYGRVAGLDERKRGIKLNLLDKVIQRFYPVIIK